MQSSSMVSEAFTQKHVINHLHTSWVQTVNTQNPSIMTLFQLHNPTLRVWQQKMDKSEPKNGSSSIQNCRWLSELRSERTGDSSCGTSSLQTRHVTILSTSASYNLAAVWTIKSAASSITITSHREARLACFT